MGSKLILNVKRKDRFCKIHAVTEDNGVVKYYTNTSNLFDLRDGVSMGIYKETYHSTWDEVWEFFANYMDIYRRTEKIPLSKYIPDWLLLDPVYVSPELLKWIIEELSSINNQYDVKEYEMGRIVTWIKYRRK